MDTTPLHEKIAAELFKYMSTLGDRSMPVVTLASPNEIRAVFKERGIPVRLEPGAAPSSEEDLVAATQLILEYSLRTGSPLFFNQLYGRADPVSIAGDWISSITNTNSHTFECAPCYTVLETELLRKVASVIGGRFADAHDGLMTPGGSFSNIYGMHLARHRAYPDISSKGSFGAPRLVAFCSTSAHYSFLKAARLLGIGSDNLVKIPCCPSTGAMSVNELECAIVAEIKRGGRPFFVGSTGGTTVAGAFDDFHAIQDVCDRYGGLWHHVDACWGGSFILSNQHRHLLSGSERADSFCWNPHKMLGACLTTSIFLLTGSVGQLEAVNATNAPYLFQPDKLYREYDCGDKTIQCGRKTDSLKLWMLWKRHGDEGLERLVDKCYALREYFAHKIKEDTSGAWKLVIEPSCTNLCFWFVPAQHRPFSPASDSEEKKKQMHRVAPQIKAKIQRTGGAMIGFQCDPTIQHGDINFFRIVFASCNIVQFSDIDDLMKKFEALGEAI